MLEHSLLTSASLSASLSVTGSSEAVALFFCFAFALRRALLDFAELLAWPLTAATGAGMMG